MPGRVAGKIAFITGAARGQGRSHAITLAREGADIIAVDVCADIEGISYPGATEEDLAETVAVVEALDRRIVSGVADVRDRARLGEVLNQGVAELGGLDIVVANAGIFGPARLTEELDPVDWQRTIDVNLTGVWNTVALAIPHLKAGGRGGSIILTSSTAGLAAMPRLGHYVASKHGVVGLMRTFAQELARDGIRVNCVNPTNVLTTMIDNEEVYRLFRPDLEAPTLEDLRPAARRMNLLPVPWVEVEDVSNAVLFLAADESRYITGVPLPVDAGVMVK